MFVYRVSKIRCLQRLSMLFPWDFYRDIMNYYDIPSWKPRWTSKKLEDDWPWVVLYVFGFYNDRVLVLCVLLFKLNVSHGFWCWIPPFPQASPGAAHAQLLRFLAQLRNSAGWCWSSTTVLGLATAATSQKRHRRCCPLVPSGNLT